MYSLLFLASLNRSFSYPAQISSDDADGADIADNDETADMLMILITLKDADYRASNVVALTHTVYHQTQ